MPSYRVAPGGTLRGSLRVPGDKSISHRAVMLGAIAEGTTRISGLLEGEDVLATLAAFRALGVTARGPHAGELEVIGAGLHGLRATRSPLDMGNSGTAMRLMAGLLCGQAFDSELIGDASLSRRPMGRVIEPLRAMGARIDGAEGGRPPLRIAGGQRLRGIDYRMPVASAQVKSSILLAGLYAGGTTSVTEPAPTRDHTERMLGAFGRSLERDGATVRLPPGGALRACAVEVPADISSAAFFLVGASIAPGSELRLSGVGINPTRTGVIDVLRHMGADITVDNERESGGEPVADLLVRHAPLRGVEIPPALVPLAIDEFPAIMVAAACAEGETVLSGAEELRVKESDRIAAVAAGLAALGVRVQERPDGMSVRGGLLRGGSVDSRGDHRIAMAFAIAALRADGVVTVRDTRNVATSFPGFDALAREAGMALETTA
jgi:3-phosphoshikimate 1-carboxyvinyltransferase